MARPRSDAPRAIGGVVPGSTAHRLMLALRAGQMTSEQVAERFGRYMNDAAWRLAQRGYLTAPAIGKKDECLALTEAGKALVAPDGALSRRISLITYCQL